MNAKRILLYVEGRALEYLMDEAVSFARSELAGSPCADRAYNDKQLRDAEAGRPSHRLLAAALAQRARAAAWRESPLTIQCWTED